MEVHREQRYAGRDLKFLIDELQSADSPRPASGQLVMYSGHAASTGLVLTSSITSNLVKTRLLNVEMFNHNANIVAVELRDGSAGGAAAPRILGPISLAPYSERRFAREDLLGRYALSNTFAVAISGALSQGVSFNVSFINEPLDLYT